MNESHTTYASVGAGGALAVLLPWLLKATLKVDMPADVAVSAATLMSGVIGYFLHQVPKETKP